MTKRNQPKKVEIEGQLYIETVINTGNCVFNKIDGSNDFGLDGYVEFVDKESVTGLCIGVQIKSGDSYQNANRTKVQFQTDIEHLVYWRNHVLPIAIIIYIPSDKTAYWLNITAQLENSREDLRNQLRTIEVPKTNVFSQDTFPSFHESFSMYKSVYTQDWNFGRALKQLVDYNPAFRRMEAIRSLFAFHRDQKETWHYLIQQCKSEIDPDILEFLIFTYSHLMDGGDIFWHKQNIIDHETHKYAAGLFKKYFGIEEI